ncbi:MAG TPA: ABC transporter permease, partial [bacterium]|nr:ABC transporter permease [bacterium]
MRSFQLGSYRKMTEDVVRSYSGYIQIHAQAYWDNKTLDYSFEPADSLTLLLRSISGVTGLIPRLESFALASGLEQTKGILVVGIDPDAEDVLTGLSRRVVQGRYLA